MAVSKSAAVEPYTMRDIGSHPGVPTGRIMMRQGISSETTNKRESGLAINQLPPATIGVISNQSAQDGKRLEHKPCYRGTVCGRNAAKY